MKLQAWVLPAAFLGVSLPMVMLLGALDLGGEFRLLIATAKKEQP